MAKLLFQSANSNPPTYSASTTYYMTPGCSYNSTQTSEANTQVTFRTAGVLSSLYSKNTGNSITANSTLRVRINGGNGNQSVSITASTSGEFEDASNTDSVSAGDEVAYQLVTGASGTSMTMPFVSTVFVPTTGSMMRFMVSGSGGISTTANGTTSYAVINGKLQFATSESAEQIASPAAGTLKNMYVYISANARSTTTTFGSRKNTSNGNLSVSVGAGLTGAFEDTSNSDTITAGDLINYFRTMGASGESLTYQQIGTEFTTTDETSMLGIGDVAGVSQNSNLTRYVPITGGISSSSATENFRDSEVRVHSKFSALFINAITNTLDSGTSTVKLRKNEGAINQTISISSGATGIFSDTTNSDVFSANSDEAAYQIVTSGTSGALGFTYIGMKFSGALEVNKSETITVTESRNIALVHQIKVSDTVTLTESVKTALAHQIHLEDAQIDQQNTTGTTGIGFGDVGSGRDYLGQGFTAGASNISAIAFYLVGKSGTSTQGYKVWIDNADANYYPTGSVGVGIGGATEITNAQLVTGALTKYNLASSVTLVPGQRYVIMMAPWNTSTHVFSSDYQDIRSSTANPYGSGRRIHGDTAYTSFSAPDAGNADIQFRTYSSTGEFITVSENTKVELNSNVNKSDSITVTEAVALNIPINTSISDSITVSENVKVELNFYIATSDTITTTESTKVELNSDIQVSDSISVSEALTLLNTLNISVQDTVTLTEQLAFEQETSAELLPAVSDSITITENTVLDIPININVSDSISVAENTVLAVSSPQITVSDNITVNESLQVDLQATLNVSDGVTVTENVAIQLPINLAVTDSITITEQVAVALPDALIINVNDSITVTDTPTVYRALIDFLLSVSDSITVTEARTIEPPRIPDPLPELIFIEGRLAYLIVEAGVPHYMFI